ncbi:MAG: sigma-70 family RNA polymerase sigma factor, partial [Chitinophagaceae bacterium]
MEAIAFNVPGNRFTTLPNYKVVRISDKKVSEISDVEVARRVIQGEKELFEILLRRYNQLLYRVIRGYLSDEKEVEDIMQDTYLHAYEKLQQFRGDASFSTWLIRIGINEALGRIRKLKKQPVLKLAE